MKYGENTENTTLDYTYDRVNLIPFLLFIKTFKNIARFRNPKIRNLQKIQETGIRIRPVNSSNCQAYLQDTIHEAIPLLMLFNILYLFVSVIDEPIANFI